MKTLQGTILKKTTNYTKKYKYYNKEATKVQIKLFFGPHHHFLGAISPDFRRIAGVACEYLGAFGDGIVRRVLFVRGTMYGAKKIKTKKTFTKNYYIIQYVVVVHIIKIK